LEHKGGRDLRGSGDRPSSHEICGHLHRFQGAEDQYRLSLWNYAIFRLPELRELAATEAAFIIISTHGRREAPKELRLWFELWLARRTPLESALVAIMDAAPAAVSQLCPTQEYLEHIAERAGMDFFCQCGEPAETQSVMEFPIVKSESLDAPAVTRSMPTLRC
jgi:hypothetical protein